MLLHFCSGLSARWHNHRPEGFSEAVQGNDQVSKALATLQILEQACRARQGRRPDGV